jgi:hypothetical protein
MKKLLITFTLLSGLQDATARPIPDSEHPSSLVDGREIISLLEMEQLGLSKGKTNIDLWSGSYWPHYQGSLAVRYRDPFFISLIEADEQFNKFKELAEKLPLYTYAGRQDLLSPAEKYDLIVGDRKMSLTEYSWDVANKANILGRVPIWRGVCDGWASASQMMPRPSKKVVMNTPEGRPITFFPEDIKALGSLLYARAQRDVIFIGKRCRSRALGLFSGACDGTNPATLHRALVNRVGKMKKTFNADTSPGKEVWNYPVLSYKMTYFNVFTKEESTNFREVMQWFNKNNNRFARAGRRHDRTVAIVGVKATVDFMDMRPANLYATDGKSMDKVLTEEYLYDLELDRRFNVVGGEALSALPDFIWAPNDKIYPLSQPERRGTPRSQAQITKFAQEASKLGHPLSLIVEQLFESAK